MFYQVVECKMTIATARGIEKYLLIHTNLKTSWWDWLFIHWISKHLIFSMLVWVMKLWENTNSIRYVSMTLISIFNNSKRTKITGRPHKEAVNFDEI